MIVKNRLLNFDNKIIYQENEAFLFSLDSVLLANFVTIKLTDKKILDMCTGNAPIPMFLTYRTKAKIYGIEVQTQIYNLGLLSVKENNMDKQITLVNENVLNVNKLYDAGSFDVVTCNPPYFKVGKDSLVNENNVKAIARHEVLITLPEIIEKASYLLKTGGTFAMVHRPDRLIEIIEIMKKNNIEPKKIRFCYPKENKEANMLLIEGVKNGKVGLKLESPLIVHDKSGKYNDEIRKMFGGAIDVAEEL